MSSSSLEKLKLMQVLHEHLNNSSVNTKDGGQAKIFYIPVYLGRYFNAAWQKYSDTSDAWIINKECHGLDSVACWAEKWIVAENVSTSASLSYLATEIHCLLGISATTASS